MKNNQTPNRSNIYVLGAIAGLCLGLVSAYLYNRAASENAQNPDQTPTMNVATLIKLGLLLLGVVRQIADLGAETGKNPSK